MRNSRRINNLAVKIGRLKICRWQHRAGSIPASGTSNGAAIALQNEERQGSFFRIPFRNVFRIPLMSGNFGRGEMSESDRVKRLQEAIEGECDGLAIDEAHARAILEYVDGETEPPAALQSALAECRDAMPIPEQGSRLEVLWGAAMGSPLDVPAYVRATMAAPQDQTPAPSAEGVRQ